MAPSCQRNGFFLKKSKYARVCQYVCMCVWEKRGVLQGQNELMLNIPYWFYCNSFLILSLFNFISLRLVGMEMRSVLLLLLLFFACVNCSYHLKPFEQDYPDGLAWCAWSFIFLLCLLFLLGFREKERELGSLLKALGEARRQQLWQREIWGKKKRREWVGEGALGGGWGWCRGGGGWGVVL